MPLKNLILALSAFIIIACGEATDYQWRHTPYYMIPQKQYNWVLVPYLAEFVADAETRGLKVDYSKLKVLKYRNFGNTNVGYCTIYYNPHTGEELFSEVYIDPILPPLSKKAVAYHEFGHCLLKLGHSPQDEGGIMTPHIHYEKYYQENWNTLLDKFFEEGL